MTRTLIETDSFPIEFLSKIGESESWRKDIYRPIYHLHKWWAKRLGSIFRGVIVGASIDEGEDFHAAFYGRSELGHTRVLDPFMGSGTTVGEAHKLGCIAFGQDINPVSCEAVRTALSRVDEYALNQAFEQIESKVAARIRELYKTKDSLGNEAEVLYFFWVKNVDCPNCTKPIDLFSTRIFSQNAYPKKKPEVQVICPSCEAVFRSNINLDIDECPHCAKQVSIHVGNVDRSTVTCNHCAENFKLTTAVRQRDVPPSHRLYAKMVLRSDGEKEYLRATDEDRATYRLAESLLKEELSAGRIRVPDMRLSDGYNTKQAIGYNYRNWRDFFNTRQLLALGWIQAAVSELRDEQARAALMQLFSSVLEFNNLFASFKGEGTGAVRHMFSHHILKPERTPLEANPWGTGKSSGSFSNLFRTKFSRLIEYQAAPFEVGVDGAKTHPGSVPFDSRVQTEWNAKTKFTPGSIYVRCGGSQSLALPDSSIDLVVTDPPFFDNVHYSELADFFFAWQSLYPHSFVGQKEGTRNSNEVQDADVESFAGKLEAVYKECRRVLRDDGIMAFSYHHSRPEGWDSVARAVWGAGFRFVNAQPVKAEMSVATPKSQADEPIQLDTIFVCRKAKQPSNQLHDRRKLIEKAFAAAEGKEKRLKDAGFKLSANDLRVIYCGQALAAVEYASDPGFVPEVMGDVMNRLGERAEISRSKKTVVNLQSAAV